MREEGGKESRHSRRRAVRKWPGEGRVLISVAMTGLVILHMHNGIHWTRTIGSEDEGGQENGSGGGGGSNTRM